MNRNSPILTKINGGKSFVLGLVAVFSLAIVGFSGTSYAQGPGGEGPTIGAPTAKADCKHDGWMQYGFENQGECVAWVNTNGYGGNEGSNESEGTQANAWWNFDISGDNNVVNLVINYLFG